MEDDHRRDIALFRYSLIREAADPELSPRDRGALVRRLTGRDHIGPRWTAAAGVPLDAGPLDPGLAGRGL